MSKIGLESARSAIAHSVEETLAALDHTGLPAIIRPSFTLGGTGGGVAYNRSEFEEIVKSGLDASPTTEGLIEESLPGRQEYEMVEFRDREDTSTNTFSFKKVYQKGVH